MVDRLNRRKEKREFSEEEFSYRPAISEYSRRYDRSGNVFKNLNTDAQLRQSKANARMQAELKS